MDRLIASNSVPFASADTAPATGTPQYATDGNPITSTPATLFPAYAWNMIQDELYNVIIAAGLTPNRNAWNQLLTAIETMLQGSTTNVAADTGAANAYVVAFTPALTAPIPWVPFWIKVAHANTGASTLNATGTVEPLVGGAHLALQGGEVVANGNALVYWNPTLAAGAGSYVLLFCSGAPDQIATGTASGHAAQLEQVLIAGGAQCRLSYSGGNLVLNQFHGSQAFIPGYGVATIPSGGVTLAPAGLTASTKYNIYLSVVSGTPTLTASTTAHATDPTGVEVMSGNNAQLFVGMEYATGTTTWGGLCRSWYNDPGFAVQTPQTANGATTSTSYVELSTGLRTGFLTFASEVVNASYVGSAANSVASNLYTTLAFDSTTAEDALNAAASPSAGLGTSINASLPKTGLAEGYHYVTALVAVTSGTGTWSGSATKGLRNVMDVSIPPRK